MISNFLKLNSLQLTIFFVVAIFLNGCSNSTSVTPIESTISDTTAKTGDKIQQSLENKAVPLAITIAAPRPVASRLIMPGIVNALPDHSVKITTAVAGKLENVFVVPGQRVGRGQLIAKLDDRHIHDQLEQATAAVQIAQANVAQTKDNLIFAKDNLDRQKKLFYAEVSAKKDIITADNQVHVNESQLVAAQSQLKSAEATARQMETELSFTQIHSPLDGIIANRYLNAGDTVDLNTPIVQVVDLHTVIINATLPADTTESVQVGQQGEVCSVAHPETAFSGIVIAISPIVDVQSNSIRIQIRCNNNKGDLREGQAVTAFINTGKDRLSILLPEAAIVPDPEKPDKSMVYIVQDGKAKRIPVTTGITEDREVEIKKGLRGGEQVIVQGVYGLPEGTKIDAQQSVK